MSKAKELIEKFKIDEAITPESIAKDILSVSKSISKMGIGGVTFAVKKYTGSELRKLSDSIIIIGSRIKLGLD